MQYSFGFQKRVGLGVVPNASGPLSYPTLRPLRQLAQSSSHAGKSVYLLNPENVPSLISQVPSEAPAKESVSLPMQTMFLAFLAMTGGCSASQMTIGGASLLGVAGLIGYWVGDAVHDQKKQRHILNSLAKDPQKPKTIFELSKSAGTATTLFVIKNLTKEGFVERNDYSTVKITDKGLRQVEVWNP